MHTKLLMLLVALALSGCATALQPRLATQPTMGFDLVDPTRVDTTTYRADYAQCAELANQDVLDVPGSAGALLSTAADRASFGLIGSRPAKHADRVSVLKRCLADRDYVVLR